MYAASGGATIIHVQTKLCMKVSSANYSRSCENNYYKNDRLGMRQGLGMRLGLETRLVLGMKLGTLHIATRLRWQHIRLVLKS